MNINTFGFALWQGRKGRPAKGRRGQSMVEFALVLPILLLFFIGTVEIGLIINDYISINRCVTDACRFGSTLVGYSSAEIMIVGKVLDSLGENIRREKFKFVSKTGTKYGPYTKQNSGTILSGNQAVTTFAEQLFYRYDNATPNDFTDDTTALPTNWQCSYVEISVEYDHDVVIPYASLFNSPQFKITVSKRWPVSALYPTLLAGQFQVGGALPIAINETVCVKTGNSVVLKGDWLLPGGFGWLDLCVEYGAGNPNANPNDLAAWITAPDTAPNKIVPPENIYSMTGQKNANSVRTALDALLGKEVMIPIYDTTGSQGNYGYYHVIGFSIWRLDSTQQYPDLKATYIRTLSSTK